MGVYVNFTDAQKQHCLQLMADHFDLFKKTCVLVFTPVMVPCETCQSDPVGRMPGNYWTDGTALNGFEICPNCGGEKFRAEELTRDIELLIDWQPKDFKPLPGQVRKPYDVIRARAKLVDAPDLLRANKIMVQPLIQNIDHYAYSLSGGPVDENGLFQGHYCTLLLQRL